MCLRYISPVPLQAHAALGVVARPLLQASIPDKAYAGADVTASFLASVYMRLRGLALGPVRFFTTSYVIALRASAVCKINRYHPIRESNSCMLV